MKQGTGKTPVNISLSAIAKRSRLVGLLMFFFISTTQTSVLVMIVNTTRAGLMYPYTGTVNLKINRNKN